jgi:dihydropteroate synthase
VGGATIFPPDRVTIVGVPDATPDSFSDGGRYAGEGGARGEPATMHEQRADAVRVHDVAGARRAAAVALALRRARGGGS